MLICRKITQFSKPLRQKNTATITFLFKLRWVVCGTIFGGLTRGEVQLRRRHCLQSNGTNTELRDFVRAR
jgi:hypothetical protein